MAVSFLHVLHFVLLQVKVVMYPKSSGTGIMANSLMREVRLWYCL